MFSVLASLISLQGALIDASSIQPRLDNGHARTPPMGWNSYNHYSCLPHEDIIKSNAKALVSLGLDKLGYRYVTTDCGWGVPDRQADGTLTWNETLFPSGFPALGEYIHDLGLLFGVYEDSGIKMCGSPPETEGSLYHEYTDAATFAAWKADALKYDNCYSDAATGYPNVNYSPSKSPEPRFGKMSDALAQQDRAILYQICEWGVDFPALWAPEIGNTWRIGNDIIPAWRAIFRTLNQAVPQTGFAGEGHWPDLDMLEVGNGVMSVAEEQTHFSLWAILKSPLTIGAALKDEETAISEASLETLKQGDVIGFNQDDLGKSASLRRRWTEEGYEVWSGPLSDGRTVAAVINWRNETRELTLDLPDIGLQYAGSVKDIWSKNTAECVRTSYTTTVAGHGTILVELEDTTPAGRYPIDLFGSSHGKSTTVEPVYAVTSSSNYNLTISFSKTSNKPSHVNVKTSASSRTHAVEIPASSKTITLPIALSAGENKLTITHDQPIDSVEVIQPTGTYHPCTSFTLSGDATLATCGNGTGEQFCKPVGTKIGYLSPTGSASLTLQAHTLRPDDSERKYVEIDYINNDISIETSFGWGTNSRNLTVTVNDAEPVRLEVPLSGRHSELFGPGLGWWDSGRLGLLLDGWREGENRIEVGNMHGEKGIHSYGADFVGFRLFN